MCSSSFDLGILKTEHSILKEPVVNKIEYPIPCQQIALMYHNGANYIIYSMPLPLECPLIRNQLSFNCLTTDNNIHVSSILNEPKGIFKVRNSVLVTHRVYQFNTPVKSQFNELSIIFISETLSISIITGAPCIDYSYTQFPINSVLQF